jgi:signal transduction histidine kinase
MIDAAGVPMKVDLASASWRLPWGHIHPLPDATRASAEQIERDIQDATRSPLFVAVLDAADAILLVLNAERQIVAYNATARATVPAATPGLRPGEALRCLNARGAGGCGTALACESCGALGAILACQSRRGPVEAECLVTSDIAGGSALEFNVRATPVLIEGRTFTVLSLRDISSEKRRDALEQVFFHDVLNTVGGLLGWAARLQRTDVDHRRAGERIDALSRQLEHEIRDHRALMLAEGGALVPKSELTRADDLLRDLEGIFSSHAVARGRLLAIEPAAAELELHTDRSLLLRVLVNMTRNALEASVDGGTVRVRCDAIGLRPGREPLPGAALRFSVHNDGAIPPEVQARIFQRSFSTKAQRGRGLGTYSMKLLGERYLGGAVSFVSDVERGTLFSVTVPLKHAAPAHAPARPASC